MHRVNESAHAFISCHCNPDAFQPPAELAAEQPGAGGSYDPLEGDSDRGRGQDIADRNQAFGHNNVDRAPDLQHNLNH